MQLIIPAFNEERRLPRTLQDLRAFVSAARESLGVVDVIVVDNASTDRTAEVARELDSSELPVRVLACQRRGKGAAVAAGMAETTDDVVGFLDADGATDLNALLHAVRLLADGVDLAIASRALDGSVTFDRHSRARATGAAAYRALTRQIARGVLDTQCGFKVMRGALGRAAFADLRCAGFSFDVELVARFQAMGARVEEFPVVWVDQPGTTFVPARHGLESFAALAPMAWRLQRLRRSVRRTPQQVAAPELGGRRVAVVNWRDPWHSEAGGSERYAWHFATALRDAGAEVEFLTARDRHQTQREEVDGIAIRRGGHQYSFYPWAWGQLVSRRLLRRGYDAVIDTEAGIPTFSPLVVSRRAAVVLVVHHVHLDQFATYLPAPLAAFARFMEGVVMPRVYRGTRAITVSESTRHEMADRLSWPREVDIVHNGADVPPGHARDGRDLERLVVLSRLATHKRIDLVIRAVDRLLLERPGLTLDVVGKGVELERLQELVTELGLQGVVTLHGFLSEEDKHRLLGSGALHVCASDVEGWGQVVIEAATHGVPTLARDVPGLRDSIRDGETGWLVPNSGDDDEADLLDALVTGIRMGLKELEQPGVQEEYAVRCRDWADHFSWSRMRRQVVAMVAEDVRQRGGRPPRVAGSPRQTASTAG